MKMGERGQVTIPKRIREQFGLTPATEIEFEVVQGAILVKKARRRLNLRKWRGRGASSLKQMGYVSVDEFLDDLRGR